jgi:RND family efflux transporter MFP subunit
MNDKIKNGFLVAFCIMFAFICILVLTRLGSAILLRQQTHASAIPFVRTICATRASTDDIIILPGNLMAWHQAPIYARTTGYIKKWCVDIGDHVQEGQLLAKIEAPELDAQLRKAEADVQVAIAKNLLAQISAKRWISLAKTDFVSLQERDEKIHSAKELAASVISATANRDRLRDLVSFERVIAPFKGTISARNIDLGDLINANNNQPDTKPLFRIVQSDPLRLYVNIPEAYSSRIKSNMQVNLRFAEHPGQQFQAQLINTSHAIDPKTRTLLAEFRVPNNQETLLPGSYSNVEFSMPAILTNVVLPVNALIFRSQGLQVATVDAHQHVLLKNISIYRDYGTHVEINAGITPGEQIILNPSDSIYNGQLVRLEFSHTPTK